MDEKVIARFWSRVDIREPCECWEWKALRSPNGYGRFVTNNLVILAHRVAFHLSGGDISRIVRHKCDNPPCCNPDHLEDGSIADNNADCISRGRATRHRGEANAKSRLTTADVLEIRELAGTVNQVDLAKRFGVRQCSISAVVRRKTWKHV